MKQISRKLIPLLNLKQFSGEQIPLLNLKQISRELIPLIYEQKKEKTKKEKEKM